MPGEMQWRRLHTSAVLEETANGPRTSRANGAMERRRARLVRVFDVRAGLEQQLNHRRLRRWIPCLPGLGPWIARVMKCERPTPIPGVRVRSSVNQRLDGERPERGRREMQ